MPAPVCVPLPAVWTDQFDNTANRDGHYHTTGCGRSLRPCRVGAGSRYRLGLTLRARPEIWEQTEGRLDAFTCATGTGGTLAGVSRFLKEQSSSTRIVLADPPGSVLYSFISSGGTRMERSGGSITEGIGQGRVTDNLQGTEVDDALHIPDEDTIAMVFRLLHYDGIYIGASSALNVVRAAKARARQRPPVALRPLLMRLSIPTPAGAAA